MRRLVALGAVLAVLAGACTDDPPESTTTSTEPSAASTTAPGEEPALQLMLMWHQHQPFYPVDDEGVVTRPWVRVHATKDYVDMVTTLTEYPDVHATFNLTPVLLTQLQDFLDGTRDTYWVHTEVPAEELTEDQRGFILRRFFDVNERIVERFPRFAELAGARTAAGGPDAPIDTFTTDEYRDLQVLFNLAWTDPDFLATEPLADLVARGRGFTEADKATVLGEHERIVAEVFDVHTEAWESGQIEVTTTPLAHPILPLIIDTNEASVGDPSAVLPSQRFSEPLDAVAQVEAGLDLAEDLLGRRPVGMWPGEGAVSRLAAATMAQAGVEWIATGEPVLAAGSGLGESFPRGEGDVPDDAALLYRPHAVDLVRGDDLPIFFRDLRLSDLVGFEYSGSGGAAAADDFMRRLEAIKDTLGPAPDGKPWVVSVILDGENAWENYDNDGKEFLNALYERLGSTPWLATTTPSMYLERYGTPDPLDHDLFPGSWFQASFATWIGEDEEAAAWDYLATTRADLDAAADDVSDEALAEATEAMLFAQGSDWFWWYGSDQSSGDDGYFDRAYRAWLARVYESLGLEVPAFVGIPIIPATPATPTVEPSGDAVSPTIDGSVSEDEWAGATVYAGDGATFLGGLDAARLSLAMTDTGQSIRVALGVPSAEPYSGVSDLVGEVGFGITHELLLDPLDDGSLEVCLLTADGAVCESEGDIPVEVAQGLGEIEVAIDLAALGTVEPGDRIAFRWLEPKPLPGAAPGAIVVPDVSNVEVVVDLTDPVGDDHGPGTYTYPTEGVFVPGSYDLTRFTVGTEGDDVVFTFEVDAPIRNPWDSAVGLSIQTFDVYIDVDPGAGSGATDLIDGRNAALGPDDGWEAALTVEGWDSALYLASPDGDTEETKPTFSIVTLSEKGKVIVRLPAALLPDGDPVGWGYAVALLGQEGFPASGVRRVREVNQAAEQYRFGGAPAGSTNHTRIIDLLLPEEGGVQGGPGEQARILSEFTDETVAEIPLVVP